MLQSDSSSRESFAKNERNFFFLLNFKFIFILSSSILPRTGNSIAVMKNSKFEPFTFLRIS